MRKSRRISRKSVRKSNRRVVRKSNRRVVRKSNRRAVRKSKRRTNPKKRRINSKRRKKRTLKIKGGVWPLGCRRRKVESELAEPGQEPEPVQEPEPEPEPEPAIVKLTGQNCVEGMPITSMSDGKNGVIKEYDAKEGKVTVLFDDDDTMVEKNLTELSVNEQELIDRLRREKPLSKAEQKAERKKAKAAAAEAKKRRKAEEEAQFQEFQRSVGDHFGSDWDK